MDLFIISYVVLWIFVVILSGLMLMVFRQFGLVYLKTGEGVSRSGLAVKKKIPNFKWDTVTGEVLEADKIKEPFVLLFTSPGCGPCQNILSELNNFIIKHPKMKIIVVSMGHKENDSIPTLRCPVVIKEDKDFYHEDFLGEVTPFAFVVSENLQVLAKGILNSADNINEIVGYSSAKSKMQQVVSEQTSI